MLMCYRLSNARATRPGKYPETHISRANLSGRERTAGSRGHYGLSGPANARASLRQPEAPVMPPSFEDRPATWWAAEGRGLGLRLLSREPSISWIGPVPRLATCFTRAPGISLATALALGRWDAMPYSMTVRVR